MDSGGTRYACIQCVFVCVPACKCGGFKVYRNALTIIYRTNYLKHNVLHTFAFVVRGWIFKSSCVVDGTGYSHMAIGYKGFF